MQKRVIIYLHSLEPLQASWVVLNEHGAIHQHCTHCSLEELSHEAKEGDITVIVPPQEALLSHATLPKLTRNRLLQALPFALEEQLITDVNELHFAIPERIPNGPVPTLIVGKQKMQSWIGLFKQFNLSPSQLINGLFALPITIGSWHASIYENDVALRTGDFSGFSCDKNTAHRFLELGLKEAELKPEHVYFHTVDHATIPHLTEEINFVHDNIDEAEFLKKIAHWLETYPVINLLQGPYQAKRKASEIKKIWLLAGYATLVWISLAFFSNLISFFILHGKVSQLDHAINTIYYNNFPEASAVVAPKERMENKFKNLSAQADKNYFLTLLAEVSAPLAQSNTIQLNSLDFRDNILSLDIFGTTFDAVDAFSKALSKLGLHVKQQNAAVDGTRVKATLLIQRGAA